MPRISPCTCPHSLDPNSADGKDNLKELYKLWPSMDVDATAAAVLGVPQTVMTIDISATGQVNMNKAAANAANNGNGGGGAHSHLLDIEDEADELFNSLTSSSNKNSNINNEKTKASAVELDEDAFGDDDEEDDQDENGNPRQRQPRLSTPSSSAASKGAAAAAPPGQRCPADNSPLPLPPHVTVGATGPASTALPAGVTTHWHPPGREKFSRRNTNPRSRLTRLTVSELNLPQNRVFRLGRLPFVLVPDSTAEKPFLTPANKRYVEGEESAVVGDPLDASKWYPWSPQDLAQRFPHAITDYYPVNMAVADVKPYLTPLPVAVREILTPSKGTYPPEDLDFPGRYMQWNVRERDWEVLTRDVSANLPQMFRQDRTWLTQCLGDPHHKEIVSAESNPVAPPVNDDGSSTSSLIEEFTTKLHWRMVVIGTEGAGMFNHYDVLPTASFQLQVHGAKRWHVCAPDQRPFLYGVAGGVDAFYPKLSRHPAFAHARCWEDVVRAGEIIFYPKSYWHQTENQITPSVAYSSSILHTDSYRDIRDELRQVCARGKFGWKLSRGLCSKLEESCYPLWEKMYGGGKKQADEVAMDDVLQ